MECSRGASVRSERVGNMERETIFSEFLRAHEQRVSDGKLFQRCGECPGAALVHRIPGAISLL